MVDGESGLLADPRDEHGLAAALDQVLLDPVLRERLGAQARERVLERFDRAELLPAVHQALTAAGIVGPVPRALSTATAGAL